MHFVFVERGFPRNNGEVGGAGTYVKIYGLELIKRGHVVSVICGKNQGDRSMYVDEGIDTGEIIDQEIVKITKGDTVETLTKKILKEEHFLYIKVLRNLERRK